MKLKKCTILQLTLLLSTVKANATPGTNKKQSDAKTSRRFRDQIMMPSDETFETVVAPPPFFVNDSGTSTSVHSNLSETYRMSSLAGLPDENIPKINIEDLLSSGSQIFSTKFNFAESQRVNSLVNQLPAFTVHQPLESLSRPMWSNRAKIGRTRYMSPRSFGPNRYDQSLQGWRMNKKKRFGEIQGQGYPSPHRQRSFPLHSNPPLIGAQFRSPNQGAQPEVNLHPLENFDSFESFEVSTHVPPVNSGRQEDYNTEVPNSNNYNEAPNNNNYNEAPNNNNYNNQVRNSNYNNEPQDNNYNKPLNSNYNQDNNYVEEPQQQQQEQPRDDYLDPPQQDDYLEPTQAYSRSPPPHQPQTRDPYLVTIPKVNEVKTTVDGNRGVKTRVYTRITDVTTVGGDGENEGEEKLDPEQQRQPHDEPNDISNIIDQNLFKEQKNPWVPYSPYVSKFNENREAPNDEVVVELEDDYEDDDTFKKRQDSAYPYQADPSSYSSQIYTPGGRSSHSRQLYSNVQPQQQQDRQFNQQQELPEEEEEEEQSENQITLPRGNSIPYKLKMDRSPDSYRIAPVQSKLQLTPDTNPNAPDSYQMKPKMSKKSKKKQMFQQAQKQQLLQQQQLQQQQQQLQKQQLQQEEEDEDKPMGRNDPESRLAGPPHHRQRSIYHQSNRPFQNKNHNRYNNQNKHNHNNNYKMPKHNQYERHQNQQRQQQQSYRPQNGFPIESEEDSDRVLLPRRKQQLRLLKQQQQQKQKQQQQPQFLSHPHQQQQNYDAFPFKKQQGTPGMNYYHEPPPGPGPAYHHEEEEERDDPADREREAFIDAKTRQLKNYFSEDEKDKVVVPHALKDDFLGVQTEATEPPGPDSGDFNENEETDEDSAKNDDDATGRSNGFFDGQPKFDFPKPDFGGSDKPSPTLGGANWDNVFNGMTNNIDKNIRAMGNTPEDYNPDDGAQAGEGGEEQQNEGEAAGQQTEEPETSSQSPEYNDYEDYDGKLPRTEASTSEEEVPQADTPESDGGEGDQSQEPNQYEDDYEQPAEKNQESGEQPKDDGVADIAEYEDYPVNNGEDGSDGRDGGGREIEEGDVKQKDDGAADISEYEDYPVSNGEDGREEREVDEGDGKERRNNDNNQHFDPHGFEKYFMKLEDGIEDEVQDNGQSRTNDGYMGSADTETEKHDPNYMDQTRADDLSPEHHEGNDPESFEFKMPSHKELQEKYKTVSTSASEIINSVVGWPGRTIAFDEMRIT